MRIRTFALGGAAALALAGLIGVTPALARTSHPATAEEIQQTDALNAQALATAQGQSATPVMPLTTAAATPAQTVAMPEPGTDASTATPPPGATPLKSLAATPSLANATVQGSNGNAIGRVKDVIDGTDGKPSLVDVALNDNSKVVAISAGELSFDSAHNVLIASLTDEQIKALPPANG